MFRKLQELITDLNLARGALAKEVNAANRLARENKQLLSKIEMAEKKGGVLLLNDINTELIEKLQSLTPDDNVVIIFTPDGGRIEIKNKDTNYNIDKGRIR